MELFWRKGEKDLEKAVDECRSVFDQINKKDGINRQAAASGSNLYECFKLFEEP